MQRRFPLTMLIVLLLILGLGLGLTRTRQRVANADSIFENSPFLFAESENEDREDDDEDGDDEAGDGEHGDGEHEEEHDRHMVLMERELRLERAEAESHIMRLELVKHIAEVASNEAATAAFAIMHFEELFDEREEGIEFLNEVLTQTNDEGAKRIMRVKLAELFMETDQHAQARRQLKMLLSNK